MDDLKLVDALVKSQQPDSLKQALASKYLLRIAEKDFEKECVENDLLTLRQDYVICGHRRHLDQSSLRVRCSLYNNLYVFSGILILCAISSNYGCLLRKYHI